MNVVSGMITGVNVRKDRNVEKYMDLGYSLIQSVMATSSSSSTTSYKNTMTIFLEECIWTAMKQRIPSSSFEICESSSFWYQGRSWRYECVCMKEESEESEECEEGEESEGSEEGKEGEQKEIVIILMEKEDLYLWKYKTWITDFWVHSDNHGKDTLDYMLVQLNKFEWMRMAVAFHRRTTSISEAVRGLDKMYVWIDFGIGHLYNSTTEEGQAALQQDIAGMAAGWTGKNLYWMPRGMKEGTTFMGPRQQQMIVPFGQRAIRFGNPPMWHPDADWIWPATLDAHCRSIKWLIAGGVFLGDAATLEAFAGIFYERALRLIVEQKTMTWEVNLLMILYGECPEWFDFYPCDHDPTILRNVLMPSV